MSREHRERMFAEGGLLSEKPEKHSLRNLLNEEHNEAKDKKELLRKMINRAKPRMKDHE